MWLEFIPFHETVFIAVDYVIVGYGAKDSPSKISIVYIEAMTCLQIGNLFVIGPEGLIVVAHRIILSKNKTPPL